MLFWESFLELNIEPKIGEELAAILNYIPEVIFTKISQSIAIVIRLITFPILSKIPDSYP